MDKHQHDASLGSYARRLNPYPNPPVLASQVFIFIVLQKPGYLAPAVESVNLANCCMGSSAFDWCQLYIRTPSEVAKITVKMRNTITCQFKDIQILLKFYLATILQFSWGTFNTSENSSRFPRKKKGLDRITDRSHHTTAVPAKTLISDWPVLVQPH